MGQYGRPNEVDDIVATFPGPVTLFPSRLKWWIILMLGVIMTATSVWVAVLPFVDAVKAGQSPYIATAVGLFGAIFFGFGMVLAVLSLVPSRSYFRLDEDGFEIVSPVLKKKRFSWGEVSDFATYRVRPTSIVVFKTANPRLLNMSEMWDSILSGRDGGLSETYGFEAVDLVRLMATWQGMALRQRGPGLVEALPRQPAYRSST
jgi:hypothetical protein